MRRFFRQLAGAVAAVALLGLAPRVCAAVFTADCTNPATNLQTVLNSTSDGDTVNVSGTCKGNFTINTAITLQGWATLDGNKSGTVVTVTVAASKTVMLTDLNIINGSGGGVVLTESSAGTLALSIVNVTHNSNKVGGGILNNSGNGGTVTFTNGTIANNLALLSGGGVGIFGNGGVTVTGSSVKNNHSDGNGGGIANLNIDDGALAVINSSITGNTAGGFLPTAGSVTPKTDGSSGSGGGIYNEGVLTVTGSAISNNTAQGGGPCASTRSAIICTLDGIGGHGGGIDNAGSGSLTNSSVQKNKADDGGGIYNEPGSTAITLTNSNVSKNIPNNIAP